MVCFTHFLRLKATAILLCALFFSAGCNYDGRLQPGIYTNPAFDKKVDVSVLVPSDKFLPRTFSFKDYNLTPVGSFNIEMGEGTSFAVADALGTLFSRVEVNPYNTRKQYDYVAEIDYTVEDLWEKHYRWEEDEHYYWLRRYWVPKLDTKVILTLRNPHTKQAVVQFAARRTNYLEFTNTAIGMYWFNKATLSLLFPVIGPAYTQITGASLRKMLEKELRICLEDIMRDIEENRLIFTKDHSQESFPRQDDAYRELLRKTAYIATPTGHGTGFFISPDGYLITNAHVVDDFKDARYYLYNDQPFTPGLPEEPLRYARVVKINKSRDLALLKAEGEFDYFELDSNRANYKTGETVLAIGNPENEFWTVTEGIISALKNKNGVDTIVTDTAINHGNSGGPLVLRSTGKVIGVNSSGYKVDKADTINFSITAFEVKRTLGIEQPIDEKKLEQEQQEREKKETQTTQAQ